MWDLNKHTPTYPNNKWHIWCWISRSWTSWGTTWGCRLRGVGGDVLAKHASCASETNIVTCGGNFLWPSWKHLTSDFFKYRRSSCDPRTTFQCFMDQTKSFDLPFCRPCPSCLFWNCKATCEGHWAGVLWAMGCCVIVHHEPQWWVPTWGCCSGIWLIWFQLCQGKASQHIETHAFSLSFNISVKPTGEYACFPSRIDLEGTLAHVALKTQLAFGICLRQVSNAKRSRREKRLIGAWDKHMLETKAMPTLERTNPVENPQRTKFFLLVTFKRSDVERYTCRFEVHIWVWSWCIVIALQTICIVWCCFILPHLHYHARLAIDR